MFRTLLQMSEATLFEYVTNELKLKYTNVKVNNPYYVAAIGNIPIVLVAHLDTVYNDENRPYALICHDKQQQIWWSPQGLGADDRAGVYMILSIIQNTKLRPHILFTTGEEDYGVGAFEVVKEKIFNNISYVIELDRQGACESVYYNCGNKEFENYINSFGFDTKLGTFTDISILCPIWGAAGVNLSVGYFNEHSYAEYFYEKFWANTYKKVIKMLKDTENYNKHWKYIDKRRYE